MKPTNLDGWMDVPPRVACDPIVVPTAYHLPRMLACVVLRRSAQELLAEYADLMMRELTKPLDANSMPSEAEGQMPPLTMELILQAEWERLLADLCKDPVVREQIARSLVQLTVALADSDPLLSARGSALLSRNQQRTLFGYFVYSTVLALALLAVLDLMSKEEPDSTIFAVVLAMTGLSGHAFAKGARDGAFAIFDYMHPAEKR